MLIDKSCKWLEHEIFRLKTNVFTLWVQKPENVVGTSPSADYESSASGSPASSSKSSQRRVMFSDLKDAQRKSISRKVDDASHAGSFPERTQAGDLFSAAIGVQRLPPVRYSLIYLVHIEYQIFRMNG